ncbi:MAG: hypothetical protein RLO21_15125, partial [Nitratireductor sp.]
MRTRLPVHGFIALGILGLAASGCAPRAIYGDEGVQPQYSFPVTNNETPYSACLRQLANGPGN